MDNLIKGAVNKIKQFATTTFKQAPQALQNYATAYGKVSPYIPFAPKLQTPKQVQQNYQNIGNTYNKLPTPVKKFGEGFVESSTLGLYDMPAQKSQNNFDRAGYVGGYVAGIVNPLNPANKIFGAMNIGQKATAGLISKVAPQATGFVAKKLLPNVVGEIGQTAGYMGLKGISEQVGLTPKNQGGFGEQLAYGLLGRGAFGVIGKNLPGQLKVQAGKIGDDDVKALGAIMKRATTNWTDGNKINLNQYSKDINLVDEILVSKYGATKEELKKIPEIDRIKNLFSMAMEDYRGYQIKGNNLVSGIAEQPAQRIKVTKDGKIKVTPQTPELTQPKINAAEKLRGYVESIQTSKKTPGQLTNQFEGMSNTTYVPKSNDKLSLFAKTLVKRDVSAAEKYVAEHFDDQAVATSHQLIDYYSRLKNFDKAAEIAVSTAEKLTEAGRTVQAASLYNKLGPSGIQRYAATQLGKFKQQLKPEDAKRLYDMSLLIQKMPEGEAKLLEQQKLMEEVGKLIPTPFLRKTVTLWKANLLTGLKTTIRNVTSNTVNFASETAKDVPATMTDIISSLFTGKRTKTFTLRGIGSGSIEGAKEGIKLLTTGVDSRKTLGKMDVTPINWGTNPVQKAAKAYTDTVFRFLGAQDKPFYYARLKQSLYDQAGAASVNAGQRGNQQFIKNLVDNPTEQMIKTAINDAEMAVFQQKTKLGSVINAAKRAVENDAKKGNFGSAVLSALGEFTVPFTGVPSGVASQLINYSPVGIAKTIIENIGKGKFDQRAFSEGIGRGLTGTAIMAIGVELAKKDLITLEYPTDAKEQQQWELEGKKPYSILWDGKWRSIGSLGPQAQAILTGAAYAKKGISGAAIGSLKSQAEQTFLKGVSSLTEAIVDPTKKGMAYVGNIVGGFVPTLASDVARATDPSQREINKTNDIKYLEDTIKSRIPVLRQELLPKRNAFGEVMQTEPSGVMQMIDIFNSSQAKTSPLVQELRRLLDIEEGATPTKISTTQSVGGQKIKLSFELQDLLESKSGPVVKRIMEETIATPQYKALTDDKRQQILQKIINDVRGVEKLKVISGAKLAPEATAKAALDLSKNQQNYLMTGNLPLNYPSAPRAGTLPTTQTEAMNRILTGQTTAPSQVQTTLGGVKFAQPTTELGKMELSKQIGAITTQINDIYDMYKMGAISEQDANSQISQLKAQQTALRKLIPSSSKGRAIKKVSLRRVSKGKTAKFKTISTKVKKLKTIKGPTFKAVKTKQPKIKVKMPKIPKFA